MKKITTFISLKKSSPSLKLITDKIPESRISSLKRATCPQRIFLILSILFINKRQVQIKKRSINIKGSFGKIQKLINNTTNILLSSLCRPVIAWRS